MLKALIWKEWRQQRSLILAGVAIAAVQSLGLLVLMSAGRTSLSSDIVEMALVITAMCVLPLFAAAMGASLFGNDMADGNLRFLLSRPVSRHRVWCVKFGSGLIAYGVLIAGTVLVGALVASITAAFGAPVSVRGLSPGPNFWVNLAMFGLATLFLLFLFVCAAYCSLFVRGALTATLAGGIMGGAMGLAAWILLQPLAPSWQGFDDSYYGMGFVTALPLAIVGIVAATYWVFCRGDLFGSNLQRRALAPVAVVTLLAALLASPSAVWGGLRTAASYSETRLRRAAMGDGFVVFPELTESLLTTRLVKVDAGGQRQVLVGRNATLPTISPDGEWIAYVSFAGRLGMLGDEADVRAVRADGTDDHRLTSSIPWRWRSGSPTISFTPDNRHVAVIGGRNTVQLASLADGTERAAPVSFGGSTSIIGWTAGEAAELLHFTDRRGPVQLLADDLLSESDREIARLPNAPRRLALRLGLWRDDAWDRVPLWTPDGEGQDRLQLLDVATGELEVLTDSACRFWGFSPTGERFFYGLCTGVSRDGTASTEVRVRELATGEEEVFATLEGFDSVSFRSKAHVSPDGTRLVLAGRMSGERGYRLHVVSAGDLRPVGDMYAAYGWLDNQTLVGDELSALASRDLAIVAVNVDTGERRTLSRPR